MPSGATKTDWPKVEPVLRTLGVEYDQWQVDASKAALARRGADGPYAAGIGGVVLSIGRQVGKTFWVGSLVFALCLIRPGSLVIWTAHRVPTAAETFRDLQSFAGRRKVAPFIENVYTGDGDESIIFKNGSRILFGSRNQGFGRGFKKVSMLILDEAQILTLKTMEDMVPSTNQADNPLIFLMGTPPRPVDPGEVFKERRRDALSGEDEDTLYIEFSADSDADLNDRKQWAKANPSYPRRTPETAMLRMKKMLGSDDSFRREALGIWDSDHEGQRAIDPVSWADLAVDAPPADGVKSFAVAFSIDGSQLSLAGALRHEGGVHVELVDAFNGAVESGIGPLADWLASRWRQSAGIVLSGRAGASVLAQALRERRVPDRWIVMPSTPQFVQACGMFLEATRDGSVTHLASEGQAALDESVAVADRRTRGTDGSWSWKSTVPGGDVTPVEAVSLAYWLAKTSRLRPRDGAERKAVIL